MNQEIRFCSTSDGVGLAYAKAGSGPPVLRVGTFLSHLEYDWQSPIWRPWLDNFSRFHTFYRYDVRGSGLSDWIVNDFSADSLLSDIEAVVEAAGLEEFALFGMSQGAAAAVWYAAHHPEKVTHLILFGGYLTGRALFEPDDPRYEDFQLSKKMFERAWADDSPGYQRWFPSFLVPEGTTEQIKWLADLQRISTSPKNAVGILDGYNHLNVLEEAERVSVPTAVFHARQDATVAFERGRQIATAVPGARFIPLQSKNHILLPSEKAWTQFWENYYQFLDVPEAKYKDVLEDDPSSSVVARFTDLTLREREMLHLIAQGQRNTDIAETLTLSPKTVRNYVSIILSKLGVTSRGEAIVLAQNSGFGQPEG